MSKRTRLAALTGSVLLGLPAAAHAAPTVRTLDGPGADVKTAWGVDTAADGSGALVYLKAVDGVDHVFVSRLENGTWGAPVLADGGGANAATRPRVAALPGGGAVATWIAGGNLRSATAPAAGAPFAAAQTVHSAGTVTAQDLDVATDGTGYATFTVGGDVLASRLAGGTWTALAERIDTAPANMAGGVGSMLEPDVVAYNGGGVVVWPEVVGMDTNLYARRLTGTTPAAAVELSVPAFGGRARAGMADMPDVAVADDGTAHVAFRESFDYGGGTTRPNVLVRRLPADGSAPSEPQQVDGLGATPNEGAETPGIAISRSGAHGLVGSPRQLFFGTFASRMTGGTWSTGAGIDVGLPTAASFPVAAVGDSGFGGVAFLSKETTSERVQMWAGGGAPEGATDNLSIEGGGPIAFNDNQTVNAAATADGTTHVAFVQGAPGALKLVVATVAPPPPETPPVMTPPVTGGPGTGGPGTGPPVRTTFGRTLLLDLPAVLPRTGRKLGVTVTNREPFPVVATIAIRTVKRPGRPAVTLGRTTATFRAGQRRTVRPLVPRRVSKGTRVTLRLVVKAPRGAARTVARTVRVG